MKQLILVGAFYLVNCLAWAQTITYHFTAPNAAQHEAEISVTATKLPAGPADFRMSRSSPGRYAKHEYGKNVYNVKAFDDNGNRLPIEKVEADVYRIPQHKGVVKVTYTLFGNHADGTYASIDRTGYHLNVPATFMWVKGLETAPITLHFADVDSSWQIATQLKNGVSATSFTAPGLQYFMDSPVKAGKLQINSWTVKNPDGKQYTLRVALEAETSPALATAFAGKVARMVAEAKAVFGEVPAFDHGVYTFIASINPYVKGDGMEHRNSTMISLPGNFDGSDGLLGVFSHEFFHCWNVERIRPADLEPFDFERSNMSSGLWLAEGFTQYYGDLILKRAGFITTEAFLRDMSGLINTKTNTPGGQDYSPVESSQRAVFVDAGVSIDQTNYANMYASYYTYGGAIALALDLDLRSRFKNTSLDDFMRQLWKQNGKPERPYTINDLQLALASITNPGYAKTFFDKYVYGSEPFDYASALNNAGLQLLRSAAGKAWAGRLNVTASSEGLTIAGNTVKNTPLYNTGISEGNVLLTLDGKRLKDRNDMTSILDKHKPGDTVPITFLHRGCIIQSRLVLNEDPWLKLEDAGRQSTPQQQTFREGWLGTKVF